VSKPTLNARNCVENPFGSNILRRTLKKLRRNPFLEVFGVRTILRSISGEELRVRMLPAPAFTTTIHNTIIQPLWVATETGRKRAVAWQT